MGRKSGQLTTIYQHFSCDVHNISELREKKTNALNLNMNCLIKSINVSEFKPVEEEPILHHTLGIKP